MSDYIKKADAVKVLFDDCIRYVFPTTAEPTAEFIKLNNAINLLRLYPSVDVAPVRHGRWKHERLPSTSGGSYAVVRCSVCEYQYPMTETNYCPNCGATMEEEKRDDED